MILVEAGTRDIKSLDAKMIFASQLSRRGYRVIIDEKSATSLLEWNRGYEAAPFLVDASEVSISNLLIIGAENISDEVLATLRSYDLSEDAHVSALGRFKERQIMISAKNKIAYATGKEAKVTHLDDLQKNQILRSSISPLVPCPTDNLEKPNSKPSVFLVMPAELLDDSVVLSQLEALVYQPSFRVSIITAGGGKALVWQSKFSRLPVFGLSDLKPETFAGMADIAVFLGEGVPGERVASFALDLMLSSGVVIDCTNDAVFSSVGAPALRGPSDLAALSVYLENIVLQNLLEIGRQTRESDWLAGNSFSNLERALGLRSSSVKKTPTALPKPKTIFVPTNGNGLGHAQRCCLVAAEFEQKDAVEFAAFPSCVGLVNRNGFRCVPLVQRSENHDGDQANDILNYLRLQRASNRGDKFVFDGGYIFDSVYRTIMEKSLDATWIRRGLWRQGQVRDSAFDREKAFTNVIVPQEAFDELNTTYTFGSKVQNVGPIVPEQTSDAKKTAVLRERLAKEFSTDFDELIISMLGGGIASDRSAQLQLICSILERRPSCLHLIVVWPGSRVSPGLYTWSQTKVVKTRNARALTAAANMVISAAGYNTFHELLYGAIPSIFIPQQAPFMDDQEARARAAVERDLAKIVMEDEMLLLDKEISAFLDGEKASELRNNLADYSFPERGNRAAAAIIEKGISP